MCFVRMAHIGPIEGVTIRKRGAYDRELRMTDRHEERLLQRGERLYAMTLHLQRKRFVTVASLAQRYRVSKRTIYRDLRVLERIGLPLVSDDTQGWQLMDGWEMPPLMLSPREAITVIVGTMFTKQLGDRALSTHADHVRDRVIAALPERLQSWVNVIEERIHLDPYWSRQHIPDPTETGGHWHDLTEASYNHQKAKITYRKAPGASLSQRTVHPLGLAYFVDHWTMVAYDEQKQDLRSFRLDRIATLELLLDKFKPPPNFDASTYWREVGAQRDGAMIRLLAPLKQASTIVTQLPARLEDREAYSEDESRVVLRFRFENLDYLADWILRFGRDVLVLEPMTLQEKVMQRLQLHLSAYLELHEPER